MAGNSNGLFNWRWKKQRSKQREIKEEREREREKKQRENEQKIRRFGSHPCVSPDSGSNAGDGDDGSNSSTPASPSTPASSVSSPLPSPTVFSSSLGVEEMKRLQEEEEEFKKQDEEFKKLEKKRLELMFASMTVERRWKKHVERKYGSDHDIPSKWEEEMIVLGNEREEKYMRSLNRSFLTLEEKIEYWEAQKAKHEEYWDDFEKILKKK